MPSRLRSILLFPIKKPRAMIKIFLELATLFSNKIVPFYNLKFPLVLTRAIHLLLSKGFVPLEALELGLLEFNFPKAELRKFVSKREMLKIERSLNPETWESLTEDKGIFYKYCNALSLPIPKLYAIFFSNTAGYSTKGSVLYSRKDWQTFIKIELPSEFIIKPTTSAYGAGVLCYIRTQEEAFIDVASGKQYNADDIYNIMFTANKNFVIQERLMNHPELIRLSETKSLQTLRIWTFIDRNGKSHILHAFLKVIVGENITDNHEHGISGNLCAEVTLDKGTLKSAVKLNPNVSGIMTVVSHPKTGISFDGFNIPLWDAALNLAKEASLKFLPMRIFGWDIAVTSNGPYIIEGNIFADPPNHQKKMDLILSKVFGEQQTLLKG
ncbi:MAG: hypothetical protein FP814_00745 [Desulfobacterium sp.]|nr:hypothetical protein [Desulfobacterium sp.]